MKKFSGRWSARTSAISSAGIRRTPSRVPQQHGTACSAARGGRCSARQERANDAMCREPLTLAPGARGRRPETPAHLPRRLPPNASRTPSVVVRVRPRNRRERGARLAQKEERFSAHRHRQTPPGSPGTLRPRRPAARPSLPGFLRSARVELRPDRVRCPGRLLSAAQAARFGFLRINDTWGGSRRSLSRDLRLPPLGRPATRKTKREGHEKSYDG